MGVGENSQEEYELLEEDIAAELSNDQTEAINYFAKVGTLGQKDSFMKGLIATKRLGKMSHADKINLIVFNEHQKRIKVLDAIESFCRANGIDNPAKWNDSYNDLVYMCAGILANNK